MALAYCPIVSLTSIVLICKVLIILLYEAKRSIRILLLYSMDKCRFDMRVNK